MPIPGEQASNLVDFPSLDAVTYQTRFLIEELGKISDDRYPSETCYIRDVFLSLAEYIFEELQSLSKQATYERLYQKKEIHRARALAKVVHELYSYIRYLLASSPSETPPGVQAALSQLTNLYFPKKENGEPVCVIRPQWKYNLKYVPLSWDLKQIASKAVLESNSVASAGTDNGNVLQTMWRKRQLRHGAASSSGTSVEPLRQLAILSFAGLDTHDVLFYPLLGHELGHFIDYSYSMPRHLQEPLRVTSRINQNDVGEIYKTILGYEVPDKTIEYVYKSVIERTSVCIRELLADLIAARMLGFSYFVSLAEFLKIVSSWDQQSISPAGYPSIKLRLSLILPYFLDEKNEASVMSFLSSSDNENARQLITYLTKWQENLPNDPKDLLANLDSEGLNQSKINMGSPSEDAVRRSLDNLYGVAKEIVPDEVAASLTSTFFERIDKLRFDLPPHAENEQPNRFAEIMSAAWAYQLLFGEQRESEQASFDEKLREYRKTCRLVLKAIELMPSQQDHSTSSYSGGPAEATNTDNGATGILSKSSLQHRINLPLNDSSRLSIVPTNLIAVKQASLEVHLGHWFAYARRPKTNSQKVLGTHGTMRRTKNGVDETFVMYGKSFSIHPGDLILCATLEFVAIPSDLVASVEGHKSIGRQGLILAGGTQVSPGYHGVITLELVNHGTETIEITPGMPIAELIFQTVSVPIIVADIKTSEEYCKITP